MKQQITKGYKVTDSEMKCRGFQYELNKAFTHTGSLEVCGAGFHFCSIAADCFNYYSFDSSNRVFEIEASGSILTEGDKSCAAQIKFTRELTWLEVLTIVNSGDRNSGYRNSGNWNSGNWNSGDRNSGYRNSGNWNSGNWNSGNWNSGDRNSGNWNSGNWNSGDWNSGNWNSGNWNSGDRNSGDRNSGDSNIGYRNSGAFCTDKDPVLMLFNKPCKMTVKQWERHTAYNLMYSIEPTIWVPSSIMTDDEKMRYPKYETTEGYLKKIPMKEAWANFWHKLNEDNKKIFTTLENFDPEIFKEITGIEI